MFIRKTEYQAMEEIINDQYHTIETLNEYVHMLKAEIHALKLCMKYPAPAADIDFPNSTKGGFEDSNIFNL